mgnify:CR=1 FL=1
MSISNIVVADDGSAHAKASLEMAIKLALKFEASLTVVHVLTHDHPPEELRHLVEVEHLSGTGRAPSAKANIATVVSRNAGSTEAIAEERVISVLAEQILKNATTKATESGVKNIAAVTKSGDYANAIIDVAEEKNADMIVMGRRGLSNLKGLLFGSVSQKVSQRANCSVLTVK